MKIIIFLMFILPLWLSVVVVYCDNKKEEAIWKKCCKLVEHKVISYDIIKRVDDDVVYYEHKITLEYLTDKGWKVTNVSKNYRHSYKDELLVKHIKVYTNKDYYYHIVEPFSKKDIKSNSSDFWFLILMALGFTLFWACKM